MRKNMESYTIIQNQNKHHQLMPWVIISLTITQMFFLILTNYVTNPFKPTEADFVVVNGENAADPGVGITKKIVDDLLAVGVDVITNITNIVAKLGSHGLVGLVAVGVIAWAFTKRGTGE